MLPDYIQTYKHDSSVNEDCIRQINFVKSCNSVFDIGAGDGFWGKLVKHLKPESCVIGIELCSEYIVNNHLNNYYNAIINESVVDISDKIYGDLVIASDVLEHLEKEQALKVIKDLTRNFKWVIINTPYGFVEQLHENPTELHRCGLVEKDFDCFNVVELNIIDGINFKMMNVFLKGK
ncbi:MAG: hypothetical protein RLY43_1873 [Bacteroidota bacterium]